MLVRWIGKMGKYVQMSTKHSMLLVLCSGLIGSLVVACIGLIPAHQQLAVLRKDLEVTQQSLEREVDLRMLIVPSYELTVIGHRNGTIETEKSTLRLSKTQQFYFMMYVSNVGDAFAHLLYYSVFLSFDSPANIDHTVHNVYYIETVVLKPHEGTSFEYTLDPSRIPSEMLGSAQHLNLTFNLGFAEASIFEVVFAHF